MKKTPSSSQYFNDNWQRYQETLKANSLYHREMYEAIKSFLIKHVLNKEFSFVDVGCGDASAILPYLSDIGLNHYIGIDAAADVLKLAESNFNVLDISKQFICDNMFEAIPKLPGSYDVIFSSYALHHLTTQQKEDFLKSCQDKLGSNGVIILVDGILKENQTREEWLEVLAHRMKTTQNLSEEVLEERMQHPREDDYPEPISFFRKIAEVQHWKAFKVLLEIDIYACMLFFKD